MILHRINRILFVIVFHKCFLSMLLDHSVAISFAFHKDKTLEESSTLEKKTSKSLCSCKRFCEDDESCLGFTISKTCGSFFICSIAYPGHSKIEIQKFGHHTFMKPSSHIAAIENASSSVESDRTSPSGPLTQLSTTGSTDSMSFGSETTMLVTDGSTTAESPSISSFTTPPDVTTPQVDTTQPATTIQTTPPVATAPPAAPAHVTTSTQSSAPTQQAVTSQIPATTQPATTTQKATTTQATTTTQPATTTQQATTMQATTTTTQPATTTHQATTTQATTTTTQPATTTHQATTTQATTTTPAATTTEIMTTSTIDSNSPMSSGTSNKGERKELQDVCSEDGKELAVFNSKADLDAMMSSTTLTEECWIGLYKKGSHLKFSDDSKYEDTDLGDNLLLPPEDDGDKCHTLTTDGFFRRVECDGPERCAICE